MVRCEAVQGDRTSSLHSISTVGIQIPLLDNGGHGSESEAPDRIPLCFAKVLQLPF